MPSPSFVFIFLEYRSTVFPFVQAAIIETIIYLAFPSPDPSNSLPRGTHCQLFLDNPFWISPFHFISIASTLVWTNILQCELQPSDELWNQLSGWQPAFLLLQWKGAQNLRVYPSSSGYHATEFLVYVSVFVYWVTHEIYHLWPIIIKRLREPRFKIARFSLELPRF